MSVVLSHADDSFTHLKMTLSDDVNLEEFLTQDEFSGAAMKAMCTDSRGWPVDSPRTTDEGQFPFFLVYFPHIKGLIKSWYMMRIVGRN
jgi:hypothetical protein